MYNTVDLKERRNKLVHTAREVVEVCEKENRELGAEDRAKIDRIMADVAELDKQIQSLMALESASPSEDFPEANSLRRSAPAGSETRGGYSLSEYRKQARNYLLTGKNMPNPPGERRDVSIGTLTSGGNLVAPVEMSKDIVVKQSQIAPLTGLVNNVYTKSTLAYRQRKITADVSDYAWSSDITQVTPDTTLATNYVDITPSLVSKLVNVSIMALELEDEIEGVVTDAMSRKFGYARESGYLIGSGSSNQPLGAFTASSNGISTGRDSVCGTATDLTADKVIESRYKVKNHYLTGDKTRWVISQDFLSRLRLLKDSQGRYLLTNGGGFGPAEDSILGIPYLVSDFVPATFSTGLYVGILGNWDYYKAVQVRDFFIQRLNERYADYHEVGFIGRSFMGGASVFEDAFVRLKMA